MPATISVRVPGSTANLGSGFDCVGIAVDRSVRVTARRDPSLKEPVRIEREGALQALAVPPQEDLLYLGFERACRAAGQTPPPGVVLQAGSDIPVARGLGSSAAAVVAGALAARALLGLTLDDAAVISVCAEIEGHADNVAPSVRGGAALVLQSGGRLLVTPLDVHPSLVLIFAIPDFMVSTERARSVLPKTVDHHTAVIAAARGAALVRGLASADPGLLAAGLDDVLHVPFRRSLIRGYDDVTSAAIAAGAFGATLSGSGSTLVAVGPAPRAAGVESAMAQAWRTSGVGVETFRLVRPARGYEVS